MSGNSVEAAVLAGGKGSRFKPFTDLIPKPLIPLGEKEKPILEYIVSWMSRHGIRDVTLLVGYKSRQIMNYFHRGEKWGLNIKYSLDDDYDGFKEGVVYRGTGGALLKAVYKGVINGDTILVWYGDIIADVELGKLLEKHYSLGADATLVVGTYYQVPVGIARLEGDMIVELREKPRLPLNPSIGVLVVEKEALIETGRLLGGEFDIMAHLIPEMINRGSKVAGFLHEGFWYDVGSLEKYQKLPGEAMRILDKMSG